MGLFSRITEVFSGRKPQAEAPRTPTIIPQNQYEEVQRLKEEVDWLAYVTGGDAEFTYGEDGTMQQGVKSQRGAPGGMFSYGWAYNQGLVRPGYFACFCINEAQYRIIRTRSRAFCTVNPYWKGVQHNLKTHVVGRGHSWIAVPKRDDLKVDDKVLAEVQQELDDFYCGYGNARRCYRDVQCEKAERKSRDGEYILQYLEEDERLRVRFVEPLLLWTPEPLSTVQGVYFGIQFENGDYETPTRYHIRQTEMLGGTNLDDEAWVRGVDANEIQHGKVNVDRQSPRGIPDTYWVQQRLEQAMRTLKASGTLVQVRSKIAMVRRRANALAGSVQSILSEKGMATMRGGGNAGAGPSSVMEYPEGAVVDASQDVDYSFPSQNLEIKETCMAIQAELQSCATSVGLADYMVSGTLGSGASYAASMVSEGPVVKTFEEHQIVMIQEDREVATRAIHIAMKHGRVTEGALELIDIEMYGPPTARMSIQEAQANQIKLQSGVLSTTTWQLQVGLNPARERANIARYPSPATAGIAIGAKEIHLGETQGSDEESPEGGQPAGQDKNQPRNRQKSSARPFSAGDEPRNMQRASGATTEEVIPEWEREWLAANLRILRGRVQETSHENSSLADPTAEDFRMAAKTITPEYLEGLKKEILAIPDNGVPPRQWNRTQDYKPGIQGVYLGVVDAQKVWAVDADACMIVYNEMDFVVAGNSQRYDWVPDDVILADWAYLPRDIQHNLYHEAIETKAMEELNWSYPRAHKLANHYEREWMLVLRPELATLQPSV